MESTRTRFDDRLAVKPEEAARMVGLSRTKFFEHLAKGEIRSFKDGRSRLIPVESLKEWIAKQLDE
jgi:excisionase family DNA binding protein